MKLHHSLPATQQVHQSHTASHGLVGYNREERSGPPTRDHNNVHDMLAVGVGRGLGRRGRVGGESGGVGQRPEQFAQLQQWTGEMRLWGL